MIDLDLVQRDEKGYSLLELIVVMAIIGLMSIMIITNFSGSSKTIIIRTTLKELSATLRKTRSLAISEKKTYIFHLDTSKKEYFISPKKSVNSEDDRPNKLFQSNVKDGVLIKGFKSPGDTGISLDETINILFYPQGNSSGGTIILEGGKENTEHTITINEISGRVIIGSNSR